MTTVKTIRQHTTTYTINQMGNRSFRITYVTDSSKRIRHVEKVWSSLEEAEEYIATCNGMDAMLALGEGKYIPQQRYDAANTTQLKLKLNTTTDADILAHLDNQDSKQGYIKALIRADIATSKEEEKMAYMLTAEERSRILEGKKKAVVEGKSRVFANWNRFAGITQEEFLAALEWLHDDPMTDGKLTRELGCTMPANAGIPADKRDMWGEEEEHAPGVDGLHRLTRRYYSDGSFQGLYDERGHHWGGIQGDVSISCIDKI